MQLGRLAAHNMVGQGAKYEGVPFFWTNQYWVITKYIGHAPTWDEIVYDGDPANKDFIAYYVKDGTVLAVAGLTEERKLCTIADIMKEKGSEPITVEEIRQGLGNCRITGPIRSPDSIQGISGKFIRYKSFR